MRLHTRHERKLFPIDPAPLRLSSHFMLKESKTSMNAALGGARRDGVPIARRASSGFAASPLFPILEIICCR